MMIRCLNIVEAMTVFASMDEVLRGLEESDTESVAGSDVSGEVEPESASEVDIVHEAFRMNMLEDPERRQPTPMFEILLVMSTCQLRISCLTRMDSHGTFVQPGR